MSEGFDPNAIVEGLDYSQLSALERACEAKMQHSSFTIETDAHQHSILLRMLFREEWALRLHGMLKPENFDIKYRRIAQEVWDYIDANRTNPGDDLHIFSDIMLKGDGNEMVELERRAIMDLYDNPPGVPEVFKETDDCMAMVKRFVARLNMISAAAQIGKTVRSTPLNNRVDLTIELNDVWREAMAQAIDFEIPPNPGSIEQVIEDFTERPEDVFPTGIAELDKRRAGPRRGGLHVLISGTKDGKSHWLTHLGRTSIFQRDDEGARKKVLHISLEMGESEVRQRYYQSILGIVRRPGTISRAELLVGADGAYQGYKDMEFIPELVHSDPRFQTHLKAKAELHQRHLDIVASNLRVKGFAGAELTIAALESFMDNLEVADGFKPDLLLLDYAELMHKPKHVEAARWAIRDNYEQLRRIAGERNIAVATVHQANRQAIGAKKVTSKFISEDFSAVRIADTVLTLTRNEAENSRGLATIYIDSHRHDESKVDIAIEQCYDYGVFALNSCLRNKQYVDDMGKSSTTPISD